VVGAREHGVAAGRLDGVRYGGRVRRHRHRPDPGLHGAPPDMHDHRLAEDLGKRLVRQARRRKAGRDEDDGIGHGKAAG
jgi:hypothetical protein